MIKTSKIIKTFGTWAVTMYGIECLTDYYPIEKRDIKRKKGEVSWEKHMSGKTWVKIEDFRQALEYAKEIWFPWREKCQD